MKRLVFFVLASAVCVSVNAEWSQYHGNAQRSGRTSIVGPVTPTLRWTFDLNGPMISSPVIARDGTIYTGSVWNETLSPSSWIYAINPNGTLKWKYETKWVDNQVASSPALGPKGQVFVGAADGVFYALSPQGRLLWKYQAQQRIESHPVAFGDFVYVNIDGMLTAFRLNGKIAWRFNLDGANFKGGPSVGLDGTIYASTLTKTVAVNPDGTLKWQNTLYATASVTPVVSPNGDVIVAGDVIAALDPATGNAKWVYNRGWSVASFGAPAVDLQGNVYYSAYVYVWKISPTGVELWEKLIQGTSSFLGSSYCSMLIDGAGKLYSGMGTGKRWAIDVEKNVFVWNSSNGAQLGAFSIPEVTSISSPALGPDGTLYIGCLDGKLYALKE